MTLPCAEAALPFSLSKGPMLAFSCGRTLDEIQWADERLQQSADGIRCDLRVSEVSRSGRRGDSSTRREPWRKDRAQAMMRCFVLLCLVGCAHTADHGSGACTEYQPMCISGQKHCTTTSNGCTQCSCDSNYGTGEVNPSTIQDTGNMDRPRRAASQHE